MRLAKWITAICFVAQTANRMAQCGMKLLAAATPPCPRSAMHKVARPEQEQEGFVAGEGAGEKGSRADDRPRVELLLTPKVCTASLYTYA